MESTTASPLPNVFRPMDSNELSASSEPTAAPQPVVALPPPPANPLDANNNVAQTPTNTMVDGLVKGSYLPPLSQASDIPFLKYKLFRRVVFVNECPEELLDLNSEQWKITSFLAKAFKLKGKQVPRQFPFCLLEQAKTLTDRMIVVNWWINHTREEQKIFWTALHKLFSRPTRSSSPLGIHWKSSQAQREAVREQSRQENLRLLQEKREEQARQEQAKREQEQREQEELRKENQAKQTLTDSIMDILDTTGHAGGQEWIEDLENATIAHSRSTRDWGLDSTDLQDMPCHVGERFIRNNLLDVIACAEQKHSSPQALKERLWQRSEKACLEYGSYKKHKFDQTELPPDAIYTKAMVELKAKLDQELQESEEAFRAAERDYLHKQGMARAMNLLTKDMDPSLFVSKKTSRKKRKKNNDDGIGDMEQDHES